MFFVQLIDPRFSESCSQSGNGTFVNLGQIDAYVIRGFQMQVLRGSFSQQSVSLRAYAVVHNANGPTADISMFIVFSFFVKGYRLVCGEKTEVGKKASWLS